MNKILIIAIFLTGILASCSTQKGTIGCDGIMRDSQIDTTQTDSTLFVVAESDSNGFSGFDSHTITNKNKL